MNGYSKIAELLMEKSDELDIELNAQNGVGYSAFHLACLNGHSKIAEMLMLKSAELNIELNSRNKDGSTAFHIACRWRETMIFKVGYCFTE